MKLLLTLTIMYNLFFIIYLFVKFYDKDQNLFALSLYIIVSSFIMILVLCFVYWGMLK